MKSLSYACFHFFIFFQLLGFPFLSSLEISQSKVNEELAKHIKYNPNGPNAIGHIFIGDRESEINQSTWLYVNRALEYYKKNKPAFIILELNTPGGEVFAAQKISDALMEMDTQYNIPVIAFINNWAISAGAMLAYSCRFIAIVKDASMGAAEPLIMSGSEMKEASEKVNSAMRADFGNRAAFFDRNSNIAEGMVDKDIILVMRNGQILKVDNESQIITKEQDPDILIKPKGKLLTLNAQQLISYGVADMLLPPAKLESLTTEEKETGKWPASKTLLFQNPFFAKIPHAVIDNYEMDWKTRFFVFLANPIIASILFLGMVVGFYVELNNPGLSLPRIDRSHLSVFNHFIQLCPGNRELAGAYPSINGHIDHSCGAFCPAHFWASWVCRNSLFYCRSFWNDATRSQLHQF